MKCIRDIIYIYGSSGPTSSMAAVLLINAGLDPNEPGYCVCFFFFSLFVYI